MTKIIKIKGARVNNLKDVSLDIPRDKFIVVSGLSGSGKSSLVFDLIYAESQRRYVESLSAYARQFLGLIDKPDVDLIEGLVPAISIDQKSASNNPRSTVGTMTEIYDYIRLLFSRIGKFPCPKCGKKTIRKRSNSKKNNYKLVCPSCDFCRPDFRAIDFSFNSGQGACPACGGLGVKMEVDPKKVLNLNLNIPQGAIKPWLHYSFENQKKLLSSIEKMFFRNNIDINTALKDLNKKSLNLILKGDRLFPGVLEGLNNKYQKTDSRYIRQKIGSYMRSIECPQCLGRRLKDEVLTVKFSNLNIHEISSKNIKDLKKFFSQDLKLSDSQKDVFQPIAKEIMIRLDSILKLGLSYLSINRPSITLSGGESQRLRLANQIGSNLVGLLYVLDEPSIGLHPRDNDNLISILKDLKNKGNSLMVIEHDPRMIMSSDHVVDVGPMAGDSGGEIIYNGNLNNLKKEKKSLTAQYLFGYKNIPLPENYRKQDKDKFLKIVSASENNLKNIDVNIPLENLVAISGVSGSGKSSLIFDILAKALNKKFYRSKDEPGEHKNILGTKLINKVIDIDQSPIGRTPRSNPATYTGIFSHIRDLFSSLDASKKKALKASHFSFNLKGGRCEKCQGDGLIKLEMQFLSDVYIKCDKCRGRRYRDEILEVKYNNKNIFEVLEMTIQDAIKFFSDHKKIKDKLEVLNDIGMGYVKLGQSATTLSGGESQRIKLAHELARPSTGKTLYILDEPTTGLHFEDIKNLLKVLHALVDKGNTVLIIEHNLDIIKSADWIIDLGPEGGDEGGEIIASGPPKLIAKSKKSYTGKYLKKII